MLTELERQMCELVLATPEHEIGEPCEVHEVYKQVGQALGTEPNSEVLKQLWGSLYDDGRNCPLGMAHWKARKLLNQGA